MAGVSVRIGSGWDGKRQRLKSSKFRVGREEKPNTHLSKPKVGHTAAWVYGQAGKDSILSGCSLSWTVFRYLWPDASVAIASSTFCAAVSSM
jgi:hypothetical protein